MSTANIAEAIDGDLDRDVDIADFLIFVNNFGKKGPPIACSDTIYVTRVDTLYIKVGAPIIPYDRDLYKHWIDANGDC